MEQRIDDRIIQIHRSLASLKSKLDAFGYEFARPNEVLPGPKPEDEEQIARIIEIAGAIPKSIQQFWRLIGGVDFCGFHRDWEGVDCPDPIVVFPPSLAVDEIQQAASDQEEYFRCFGGFRIPIAPDSLHKEGVSGGMWYGIAVPNSADDASLLEEPHGTTFLKYLDIVMQWGGFPGIEDAGENHSWPLAELRAACRIL